MTGTSTLDVAGEFEPWEAALGFHFVIALAAFLTLTFPVDVEQDPTKRLAWDAEEGWDVSSLWQALVIFSLISCAFFNVQNSDPGWLTAEIVENNNLPVTGQAYCQFCRLTPPVRAHHCRLCQKCVATFDHHCEVVGTCIGERNRSRYWCLLAVQALGIGRCVVALYHVDSAFSLPFSARLWHKSFWLLFRISVAYLYIGLAAVAAILLLLFHTGLALTNSTTRECLRWRRLKYMNGLPPYKCPFSQGILENLKLYGCFCFQWGTRENDWKPIPWYSPHQKVH